MSNQAERLAARTKIAAQLAEKLGTVWVSWEACGPDIWEAFIESEVERDALQKRVAELEKLLPDEGRMPSGDDIVIATHEVLVPYGMKCHKCGAPEPWKD